jgi:hypothetical protein
MAIGRKAKSTRTLIKNYRAHVSRDSRYSLLFYSPRSVTAFLICPAVQPKPRESAGEDPIAGCCK